MSFEQKQKFGQISTYPERKSIEKLILNFTVKSGPSWNSTLNFQLWILLDYFVSDPHLGWVRMALCRLWKTLYNIFLLNQFQISHKDEEVREEVISLYQTVQQFKGLLHQWFDVPMQNMKLYYCDQVKQSWDKGPFHLHFFAAFTHTDPKSAKKTDGLTVFFCAFGICRCKSCAYNVGEINLGSSGPEKAWADITVYEKIIFFKLKQAIFYKCNLIWFFFVVKWCNTFEIQPNTDFNQVFSIIFINQVILLKLAWVCGFVFVIASFMVAPGIILLIFNDYSET